MQPINCKRKKFANFKKVLNPIPFVVEQQKIDGIFTGISVDVLQQSDIKLLYEHGCYGKGSCSRGAPQLVIHPTAGSDSIKQESLVLSLEEAFFLCYVLNVLKISNIHKEVLSWERYINQCLNSDPKIVQRIAAYLYLKSKNWVVKSGIKFGGDFLIYKAGPSYFHASFLVIISNYSEETHFVPKQSKGLQRIAETSDKDVLILEITEPSNFTLEHLDDFKKLQVSETIIRRFNYASFLQQQQQQQ